MVLSCRLWDPADGHQIDCFDTALHLEQIVDEDSENQSRSNLVLTRADLDDFLVTETCLDS